MNLLPTRLNMRLKGEIAEKSESNSIERTRGENDVIECKNTSFTLIVSDNGIGIPDNFYIENFDTLGFQSAVSLVDQLGGKFMLRKDSGTEFIIRFIVTENIKQAS